MPDYYRTLKANTTSEDISNFETRIYPGQTLSSQAWLIQSLGGMAKSSWQFGKLIQHRVGVLGPGVHSAAADGNHRSKRAKQGSSPSGSAWHMATRRPNAPRSTAGEPPPPQVLDAMRAAMQRQPGLQLADISGGLEAYPIPVVNTVDDVQYDTSLYKYTRWPVVPPAVQARMDRSPPLTCTCAGNCGGVDDPQLESATPGPFMQQPSCTCVDGFDLAYDLRVVFQLTSSPTRQQALPRPPTVTPSANKSCVVGETGGGVCGKCLGALRPGQNVTWVRNGPHAGRRYHAGCKLLPWKTAAEQALAAQESTQQQQQQQQEEEAQAAPQPPNEPLQQQSDRAGQKNKGEQEKQEQEQEQQSTETTESLPSADVMPDQSPNQNSSNSSSSSSNGCDSSGAESVASFGGFGAKLASAVSLALGLGSTGSESEHAYIKSDEVDEANVKHGVIDGTATIEYQTMIDNETPATIAELVGSPVDKVIAANVGWYPDIKKNSRFKRQTCLRIPAATRLPPVGTCRAAMTVCGISCAASVARQKLGQISGGPELGRWVLSDIVTIRYGAYLHGRLGLHASFSVVHECNDRCLCATGSASGSCSKGNKAKPMETENEYENENETGAQKNNQKNKQENSEGIVNAPAAVESPSCAPAPPAQRRDCGNRVVQHGIRPEVLLEVFRLGPEKGWGVRSRTFIRAGTFVCEYAGELLTDREANERGKAKGDDYLFDLDMHVNKKKAAIDEAAAATAVCTTTAPADVDGGGENSTTADKAPPGSTSATGNSSAPLQENGNDEEFAYDAKHIGNVGRFLNHSCAPNLMIQNVLIGHGDVRLTRIAFFAGVVRVPRCLSYCT